MSWTTSDVVIMQENRTEHFSLLVGRGAIEFKWTDDKGTHKEQGELDFWKNGDAISLRITKLGELVAWFGGEGNEYWHFDLMGDEPTLTLGGDVGLFYDIDVALVLLGLKSLPQGDMQVDLSGVVLVDEKERVWRTNFDPSSHRPTQIELTDGELQAKAIHHTPIRVEIENLHELHWPVTGGIIDLTDNQGNSEIKIAFSFLSTIVEDEPMDRVMNLEYLKGVLQPTTVIGE